jgi:nucleotide-binding universal stress UspA family protein
MKPTTKILVPVDFSDYSSEVVSYAADLASRFEAALHLLHVQQPMTYTLPDNSIVLTAAQLSRINETLTKLLTDLKQTAQEVLPTPVEATLLEGFVANEIVRFAKDSACDLIVMGTHGRTGFKHWLLGSVAEYVVRTAHCPVLTVRLQHADAK